MFEIRPITEDALEDVLEVYRQCEDFLSLGPEPKASLAMVMRDIETSRQDRGIFSGIYAAGGQLIGVVDYIPSNFDGAALTAFISLLMIVPASRNSGIGTITLGLVETRIRALNEVREIEIAVQLNNPAGLRFWQRNGYRVFGDPIFRPDQTVVTYLRKDLFSPE